MFGSVSGLMPKRNNALTPIAKVMVSQERRQLGKEYICFWNRKNNRNALPWKVERLCYCTRGFPHGKTILPRRKPPDKNYFGGNYGKQNDPDRADQATAGARGREAAAASVYRRAAAGVRGWRRNV